MSIEQRSTHNGFANGLLREAQESEDFVVMDADLAKSTRGRWFRDEYPDRWFNNGIAEQDMFATAAGVASTERPVFTSTFAIFAQRGFEQIRQQIARIEQNVTVVGSHAGVITGKDGASAQTIEDISSFRGLPNMRVVSPADAVNANKFVTKLAADEGPAYLRLVGETIPVILNDDHEPEIGHGETLREGADVTLTFSIDQTLIAAKNGATKILPSRGPSRQCRSRRCRSGRRHRGSYHAYGFDADVLAASVRPLKYPKQSAKVGTDTVTLPPGVAKSAFGRPEADSGRQAFLDDWNARDSPVFR